MIMSQDSHTQSPISQIGDMLDDGLILTNLDGVIRSANPAAVRWFGENLTGQKIFDVINHPNIGDLFAKAADGAKRCEMRYEPTNIIQREFRMRLQRNWRSIGCAIVSGYDPATQSGKGAARFRCQCQP
jgi:PAS domain-containing protein